MSLTDVLKTVRDGISAVAGGVGDVGEAFWEAGKKAWETEGVPEKFKTFFETLWDELKEIFEEKKEVTDETRKEIQTDLQDTVKGQIHMESGLSAEDTQTISTVLDTSVAYLASTDFDNRRGNLDTAIKKLEKAGSSTEKVTLDSDEIYAVAALGLNVVKEVRKAAGSDDGKFKSILTHLLSAQVDVGGTMSSVSDFLTGALGKMFDVSEKVKMGLLAGKLGLSYIDVLGITSDATILQGTLSKSTLEETDREAAGKSLAKVFPKTVETKRDVLIDTLRSSFIFPDATTSNTQKFIDFVAIIHPDDFEPVIKKLLA